MGDPSPFHLKKAAITKAITISGAQPHIRGQIESPQWVCLDTREITWSEDREELWTVLFDLPDTFQIVFLPCPSHAHTVTTTSTSYGLLFTKVCGLPHLIIFIIGVSAEQQCVQVPVTLGIGELERRVSVLQHDKSVKRQIGAACRKISGVACETISSFRPSTFLRRDETPNKTFSHVARFTNLQESRKAEMLTDDY